MLLGGITRLTGSGLSITEWKPLSGAVPPPDDAAWQAEFDKYQAIPQFKQLNAHFELSDFTGVAALFCMVLFLNRAESPGKATPGVAVAGAADLKALLADQNPVVRALAAEVARNRQDASSWAPALVQALGDADPAVRDEAHRSLVELNRGEDLGPAGDAAARAAWKKRFP